MVSKSLCVVAPSKGGSSLLGKDGTNKSPSPSAGAENAGPASNEKKNWYGVTASGLGSHQSLRDAPSCRISD